MQILKNEWSFRLVTIFVIVISGAAPLIGAQADTLSDLRITLQGLNAHTVINRVLDVQSNVTRGKADSAKHHSAHLQLNIQAGNGLDIQLSPALLQQVAAEKAAHAADPDHPASTADLLDQTGPWQIENMVSAAPMLLRMLSRAETPVVKPVTFAGTTAQELTVQLPPPVSKKDSSGLKDFHDSLSLWLNGQGVPQAYQEITHGKFCKFFLCVTFDELDNGTLQVIDGRLVTVILTQEPKQSGLGQDSDTRTVYTLQIQGSPAPAKTAPAAVSKPN